MSESRSRSESKSMQKPVLFVPPERKDWLSMTEQEKYDFCAAVVDSFAAFDRRQRQRREGRSQSEG